MTTHDRGSPKDHAFDSPVASHPKISTAGKIALSGDQVASFLVQITRGIWRLESAVERSKIRGEPISQDVQATIEHLHEDLESLGLQATDPTGQTYEPGMRVEVAQREPGGSGNLMIKQTILAGVTLNGSMLKPASVVVGREELA